MDRIELRRKRFLSKFLPIILTSFLERFYNLILRMTDLRANHFLIEDSTFVHRDRSICIEVEVHIGCSYMHLIKIKLFLLAE